MGRVAEDYYGMWLIYCRHSKITGFSFGKKLLEAWEHNGYSI